MANNNETIGDQIKTYSKKAFDWIVRYPLALIAAFVVLLVASALLGLGVGDRVNWGGILGSLFGENKDLDQAEKANKIPDERVHENGEIIKKNEPDEEGYAQREVKILDRSSNPFRDKTKIKIITKEGSEKKISLPTGVEDTDVSKVLEIKPKVYRVEVKERPEGRIRDEDLDLLG